MNFELSLDEINLILTVLSKQPYENVVNIIEKIQFQAKKQLEKESKK
jgi:hypothetical protein